LFLVEHDDDDADCCVQLAWTMNTLSYSAAMADAAVAAADVDLFDC
jgi:hypothetical protein